MVISTGFINKHGIGALSLILLAMLVCGVASAADKIRIGYSGVTVSNAMLWVTEIAKRTQIKDEKAIEDTYLLLKSFVPIKLYPTLDGFKTIFDDLSRKVPAAKTANPKEFVDTRFIDELDQSGYIDSLYK